MNECCRTRSVWFWIIVWPRWRAITLKRCHAHVHVPPLSRAALFPWWVPRSGMGSLLNVGFSLEPCHLRFFLTLRVLFLVVLESGRRWAVLLKRRYINVQYEWMNEWSYFTREFIHLVWTILCKPIFFNNVYYEIFLNHFIIFIKTRFNVIFYSWSQLFLHLWSIFEWSIWKKIQLQWRKLAWTIDIAIVDAVFRSSLGGFCIGLEYAGSILTYIKNMHTNHNIKMTQTTA